MDVCFRPARTIAGDVRRGERSPVAVVDAFLDRIDDRDEVTNAYVTVCEDRARAAARDVEAAVDAGEDPGPLAGVPVAVKDAVDVAGVPTTHGSVPLADHVPDRTDPAVARLEAAGAVVLGKTNTSEFGHVAVTDNDLVGPTANPFDPDRTAGGSSGGSAAAVADGLAAAALGVDAGGSIRVPASACGVVGLKPAFGRVPRDTRPDAFSDARPFTHTGPIARTVGDAALLLDVLAGPHRRDPFSLPAPRERFRDAAAGPGADGEGSAGDIGDGAGPDPGIATVAYSPDLGSFPVDERVLAVVDDAVAALEGTGHTVERPDLGLGAAWEAAAEQSASLFQSRLATLVETSRSAFGVDLREREDETSLALAGIVEAGRDVDAVEVGLADGARTALYDAVEDAFAEYDLLATPTLAVPPFELGVVGPDEVAGESISPFGGWFLTLPFNLTGHPAASVPAGWTDDGLPVGLQLAAGRHAEDDLLAACAAYERARPWDHHYPPRED